MEQAGGGPGGSAGDLRQPSPLNCTSSNCLTVPIDRAIASRIEQHSSSPELTPPSCSELFHCLTYLKVHPKVRRFGAACEFRLAPTVNSGIGNLAYRRWTRRQRSFAQSRHLAVITAGSRRRPERYSRVHLGVESASTTPRRPGLQRAEGGGGRGRVLACARISLSCGRSTSA